jgi:cytochrome c oxidase cbb3-type subunit 3
MGHCKRFLYGREGIVKTLNLKFVRSVLLLSTGAACLMAQTAQTPANTNQSPGTATTPGAKPNGPPDEAAQAAEARRKAQAEADRKFLGIGAAPDPAAVERGKTIFVSTCGFCHGTDAQGGEGAPNLVRSTVVLHDENGSTIGPVILKGRPGKGMPAFPSMTKAQISDIAAFLLSRTQAAANRGDYKIQNVVTGDAKAGQAYFEGPGKCSTCHSPTGDLAGIAKKFEPVDLQQLFLYPEGHGRHGEDKGVVSKVTVTLPSGQSFSGVLDHVDDFSVALTDSSGVYHSWLLDGNGADGIKVQIDDPLAEHAKLLRQYTQADMHNILAYLETLK